MACQKAEAERQAIIDGSYKNIPEIFQYMVVKDEQKRLDLLWAKAFHHAGIAPNAMEDDYVRFAIYETSKIKVCLQLVAGDLLCCRVGIYLQGDDRWVARSFQTDQTPHRALSRLHAGPVCCC